MPMLIIFTKTNEMISVFNAMKGIQNADERLQRMLTKRVEILQDHFFFDVLPAYAGVELKLNLNFSCAGVATWTAPETLPSL